MSIRFIYGRAGSGKTTYCFNEIAKQINDNSKIYVITPEQFSFTAEKQLLNSLNSKAVINAEVLTFNRMAYRIMSEVGGITKTALSKTGKAMLIYSILSKQRKNLKFLSKSDENVDIVSRTITEFKKHNVGLEQLKELIDNTEDEYSKAKLNDVYTMYREFENNIQTKYIDEDDTLSILAQKIDETTMFNDTIIYIDEFVGFTSQEYEIICKLAKVAKQVNITICADNIHLTSNIETDIFYENKNTVNRIKELAQKQNIKIEQEVYLDECKRFKNNELKHLEQNLYGAKYKKYDNEIENIELFLAKNQFSEIENIAQKILELVRDYSYRYNEISIITKNVDTYSSILKAIFAKYDIPVFIDDNKDLSQNILVKFIMALLEIFARNWSYEAMFNYIKTGLLNIDNEDIFLLENYCIKYGIKGNRWYKEEFKIATNDEELKKVNEIRTKIVAPLVDFKENLTKTKTCTEISKAIYQFLIDNKIEENLNDKICKLEEIGKIDTANEYKASWNTTISVLDELVLVLNEDKCSFEEYSKILKTGLKNSGIGNIPATCDQVIVGDVERSRTHKVKAVFLVGLNDGIFPSINTDEGYLNDKDREYLKQNGIEIAKGTLENLYADNFNIYKAFTAAEEKLFLSYSSSDNSGKALRPSILIGRLKKIFINLKQKSDIVKKEEIITTKSATFDELLSNIRKFLDGETIDTKWFEIYYIYKESPEWKEKLESAIQGLYYANVPEKLNVENVEKLYGTTLKTSISRLEQYKRCAFSYYLKYGLQLSDKSLYQIKSLDTGSFMHDVIDEFFNQIMQRQINLKDITQEQINQIIKSIVNEKLTLNRNYIFTSNAKYMMLTNRLTKVILKSMKYIIESIIDSEFEIFGNEVEFKEKAKYKPITIELENGNKVEISGKIDRIDIGKSKENRYVRIIDYKSSEKDIDLNEVVSGLQIQLLTYLDAVTEIEKVEPAGILYFKLIDPILKANKNMTDEEIEEKIREQFKMKGLILADINVVKMMDKKLEKGASKLVPAYIDSTDSLSYTRSSTLTQEQFQTLQKYMKKIIKQISNEILSGNIDIKPYYNIKKKKTPCEYCEYKSICNFNTNINNGYNYISNMSKEEILDSIK